jgi:hypothetical protein
MLVKNIRLVALFVLVATTIGCHGSGIDSSNARPTSPVVPTRLMKFARVHLNGCDSEKLQAKAITALSNVDAALAIELLGKVPNPCERGE